MKHKRKLTAEEIKMIEGMSAIRLPLHQMASVIGLSKSSLERMAKTTAAVREALLAGRAKASYKFRKTLYEQATDPTSKNYTMAAGLWAGSQEGFVREDRIDLTTKGKALDSSEAPKVVFVQLPSNGRENK